MGDNTQGNQKSRTFLAVIGDEDTVTGLLLAGVGHVDTKQNKTELATIEQTFQTFITRKDIAILLINQHIAEEIRGIIDNYHQAFPALLEIPSKDHPYDPSKDSVLKRVQRLFGE